MLNAIVIHPSFSGHNANDSNHKKAFSISACKANSYSLKRTNRPAKSGNNDWPAKSGNNDGPAKSGNNDKTGCRTSFED